MARKRNHLLLLFSVVLLFAFPGLLTAQSIFSGNAGFKETTAYPTFPTNDPIWYFCSVEGVAAGSLTAQSAGSSVTFLWEKFDPTGLKFVNYSNDTGILSAQTNLSDGCYRVSFTENGKSFQFRAWVMNGWSKPSAAIAESTCKFLRLSSAVIGSVYQYFDLTSGKPVAVSSDYRFRWYTGTTLVSSAQNPTIQNPPSKNTDYRVEVTDRAGCMKSVVVTYRSPIPDAKFIWSTNQKNDPQYVFPQAPANIDFQNQSINADADKYEWYLFKDKAILSALGAGGTTAIDSFITVMYDANPLYTYQNSGKYMVKLIASKTTQALTCRDTFYLPDFIVVDTSLVKVAPVFTPNGDGVNDKLIIKTRSLQSLTFTVLNRWGKVVHQFSTNNYMPENSEIAAWDGKVGGNLCPAGVYFYVADAKGRDGVRRRSKGFVEMIW